MATKSLPRVDAGSAISIRPAVALTQDCGMRCKLSRLVEPVLRVVMGSLLRQNAELLASLWKRPYEVVEHEEPSATRLVHPPPAMHAINVRMRFPNEPW